MYKNAYTQSISKYTNIHIGVYMLTYTAESRLKRAKFAQWVSTHIFILSQREVQDFENNQDIF